VPKYHVEISKRGVEYAEVFVEAERPDDAKEMAWGAYDTLVWSERLIDYDTYVTEMKPKGEFDALLKTSGL
jgi:hypothetical protein